MGGKDIIIYDTTLRDGAQAEEISFSVEDKLLITRRLDELGIAYIEGGYPGANPRDAEFFEKAARLPLSRARLAAFGATHHPKTPVNKDKGLQSILKSGAPVATIFGKTWDFHVETALRTTLDHNLQLIHDTVAYLKKRLDTVFFDAEHFFDGYARNPEYAGRCLMAASEAGADCLVLCDTNGGILPDTVREIVRKVRRLTKAPLGIHAHNDSECAVANSLIAVVAGCMHVQGTINGLGERTGNANLCSIIPNLELKMGLRCLPEGSLTGLRDTSRFVNEIANISHFARQPFVGDSAFAHKAGMHVSAIVKSSETYEHVHPETVGNSQRVLVSDLAGKSNILRKASDFGISVDSQDEKVMAIVETMKELERQGYQYEGAEGSFELLMKKALGLHKKCFDLIGFRVLVSKRSEEDKPLNEATIILKTPDGKVQHMADTGNGPVNALDGALRKALTEYYPEIRGVELVDYKVRVLTADEGTGAKVRVLIESTDGKITWNTVGVSENIIEASYQALLDAVEYKILKEEGV